MKTSKTKAISKVNPKAKKKALNSKIKNQILKQQQEIRVRFRELIDSVGGGVALSKKLQRSPQWIDSYVNRSERGHGERFFAVLREAGFDADFIRTGRRGDSTPAAKAIMSLPIFDCAHAGKSHPLFETKPVDYVGVSKKFEGKDPIVVRVVGDSMNGYIQNGDYIICSKSLDPRMGKAHLVIYNDWEVVVKYVKFRDKDVVLTSQNPEFEPLVIKQRDVKHIYPVIQIIHNV